MTQIWRKPSKKPAFLAQNRIWSKENQTAALRSVARSFCFRKEWKLKPAGSLKVQVYRSLEESVREVFGKMWAEGITGSVQAESNKNTAREGGVKFAVRGEGKYWYPKLNKSEWSLLEWTLSKDIVTGDNYIDAETK